MISKLDKTESGDVISSYKYTYNLAGNITAIDKEVAESNKSSSTLVSGGNSASGNASDKSTVTMEYSSDNRLIRYNGEEIRYDADGNMTYGPLNGEMVEFTYDCRNRLVKAGDTEYTYDAENNRVEKKTGSEKTKYVINPNTEYSQVLVATKSGNSSGDKEYTYYTYGRGLITEERSNSTSNVGSSSFGYLIHHYDQIGSTIALTDGLGRIVETYEYSTYGELLSGESSLTEFLYNGSYGVATDSNGLYYMRARYYNPTILRFINQDVVLGVLTATQSLNRYAYCEGNPISFLDPFGLSRLDTSGMHNLATAWALAGPILSAIGLPEAGLPLSIIGNLFDICLYAYDIKMDVVENRGYEQFAYDISGLIFDVLSLVTCGVAALSSIRYFKSEWQIIEKEGIVHLSKKKEIQELYDSWQKLDNIMSGLSYFKVILDLFRKE